MKLSEFQRNLQAQLGPEFGDGEAKAMIRLIFHAVKGWSVTDLIINSDREVSDFTVEMVNSIIARLKKKEPLQYILGEARFYGMNFKVTPDVLIPRPETEELVDLIVRENSASDLRVLDIGTGSGAIAIALSRNLRFPVVTAVDISGAALDIAGENAVRLKAGIHFEIRDIFTWEPPRDSFDIIVSNPPYIAESEKSVMEANVLDYEPALALFVPDGNPLLYYSRIAHVAAGSLVSRGRLYFEINPRFVEGLVSLLSHEGFTDIRIIDDISHRKRFAAAVRI